MFFSLCCLIRGRRPLVVFSSAATMTRSAGRSVGRVIKPLDAIRRPFVYAAAVAAEES